MQINPNQIAVGKNAASDGQQFPRDAGWSPSSSVRLVLKVRARHGLNDKCSVLDCCHRAGDASTADVYRASLLTAAHGVQTTCRSVVVKVRRDTSSISLDPIKIEERFLSEVRTIRDLTKRENDFGDVLSPLWNLDGSTYEKDTALSISNNLFFCSAANHALTQQKSTSKAIDLKTKPFLRDSIACAGCGIYEKYSEQPEKWASLCRPWLVSANESPRLAADYCLPATEALIYTDVGMTLQNELRQQPADFSYPSLVRKHVGLLDLARRLAKIHHAGWLHLDLNLNNICIDSEGNVRPIDFGQGEPIDPRQQNAQVFNERIPFRVSDFVVPEMQQRRFGVYLQINEVRKRSLVASYTDVAGWPSDWVPSRGDRVRLDPLGGFEHTVWMTVKQRMRGRFMSELEFDRAQDAAYFKKGEYIEATVDRISTVAADVYAYGLVALCWILGIQKPVLLRDELSVAKRISEKIKRIRNPQESRPDGPLAFWLDYRDGLGYHSTILDEICEPVSKKLLKTPNSKKEIFLFLALMRLCVQCVLRQNPLSLGSQELSFDAVIKLLEAIEQKIENPSEIADEEIILPISLQGYLRKTNEVKELVRTTLRQSDDDIQTLHPKTNQVIQCLASLNDAKQLKVQVQSQIGALAEEIAKATTDYFANYQKLPWIKRWIAIPIAELFGERTGVVMSDAKTPKTIADVQNTLANYTKKYFETPKQALSITDLNNLLTRSKGTLSFLHSATTQNRFEASVRRSIKANLEQSRVDSGFQLYDADLKHSQKGVELVNKLVEFRTNVEKLRAEFQRRLQVVTEIQRNLANNHQEMEKRMNSVDIEMSKFLRDSMNEEVKQAIHCLKQYCTQLNRTATTSRGVDSKWEHKTSMCIEELQALQQENTRLSQS